MPKRDIFIAPICEAALLLVAALTGWSLHKPLLFSSLGPTAYELIETPDRPSACTYNILVGHLLGVLSGFAGLYISHAFYAPSIMSGTIAGPRIGAATAAATLTVLLTLSLKASQPAAVATSLLIALGTLQKWQDGFLIMSAVVLILICGQPLRAWRLRARSRLPQLSAKS